MPDRSVFGGLRDRGRRAAQQARQMGSRAAGSIRRSAAGLRSQAVAPEHPVQERARARSADPGSGSRQTRRARQARAVRMGPGETVVRGRAGTAGRQHARRAQAGLRSFTGRRAQGASSSPATPPPAAPQQAQEPGRGRRLLRGAGNLVRRLPRAAVVGALTRPGGRQVGEGMGRVDSAIPWAGQIRDGARPEPGTGPNFMEDLRNQDTFLNRAEGAIGNLVGRAVAGPIDESEASGQPTAAGEPRAPGRITAADGQEGSLRSFPQAGRERLSAEDGRGGTGVIEFDEGARERTQRELGTLGPDGRPQGGTVSAVPDAAGLRRAHADVTRAGTEAAMRAMDAGDHETARLALMRPDQRQAEIQRRNLQRQISSSRGFDQTIGQAAQEGLRRRGAREQLQSLDQQQAQQAEAQQQAFDNQLALRQEGRQDAQVASQIEDRQASVGRATRGESREVLDRAAAFNDADGVERIDTRRRNLLEGVAQRAGINEEDPTAVQNMADVVGLTEALLEEAEASSEWPILRIFGDDHALPEDPQDMVRLLRDIRGTEETMRRTRRGVRVGVSPRQTIEVAGQRINLDELDPSMVERLRRISSMIPEDF